MSFSERQGSQEKPEEYISVFSAMPRPAAISAAPHCAGQSTVAGRGRQRLGDGGVDDLTATDVQARRSAALDARAASTPASASSMQKGRVALVSA